MHDVSDTDRTSAMRAIDADQTLQDQPALAPPPPRSRAPMAPARTRAVSTRAVVAPPAPRAPAPRAPAPRPEGTQEVQLQDVLEEVYLPKRSPTLSDAPTSSRAAARPAPRPGAVAARPTAAAPRANGTEEIALGDILEVRDRAPRPSGTEEVRPDDILMEVPASIPPPAPPRSVAEPAQPGSIAPFAIDVAVDWPPVPRAASLDAFEALGDDVFDEAESSDALAARVLGRNRPAARRRFLVASAGAVAAAIALTVGLALHGGASAPAASAANLAHATPSLEDERLAEVPPPPPADTPSVVDPAAELPAPEAPSADSPRVVAPAPSPRATHDTSWSAAARAPHAASHPARPGATAHGTGRVRAVGAASDEFIFVDGESVGRGEAVVACGVHNVSLGMGRKARRRIPCGGTLSLAR